METSEKIENQIRIRSKIIDLLNELSLLNEKDLYDLKHDDKETAYMITKLWNYCR